MSNLTQGWENLPAYLSYSVQGFVIGVSNLLIALSIIRYEALRTSKEYLVMLGLSLADSCNMSGFLFAGVYRMYLLVTDQHHLQRTPWECATTLHNVILTMSMPWANIMLAIVSIDRLLCVSMPLDYLGWSCKYAYGILFPGFIFSLMNSGFYLFITYLTNDEATKLPANCLTYAVLQGAPSSFSYIFQATPPVLAFLSVVIYMAVWYKHKKYFAMITPSMAPGSQSQLDQLRHQRKITVSLGMSCVCTFLLFCIPMLMGNVLLSFGFNQVAMFFYLLSTLNPLCNVFIYQIRHRELRMALKGLLCSKELPIDIRMWNVNQNAQHT